MFRLPEPTAVAELTMSDGAIVRVRRHGNAAGPRIVLSHGNGFAIDGYFPFWRRLLGDFDVFVFDLRDHGWNPSHHAAGHAQPRMAEDLETVLRAIERQFGRRPTAGAFHSVSAVVSLLHAMRHGWEWDALILFDPPLMPPPHHPLHALQRDFDIALEAWSRRRRESFAGVDELADYFRNGRRMRRWVEGTAELMAQAITRPNGDGVTLVCPGAWEAEIYRQNLDSPAWSAVSRFSRELLVVSADDDLADADPPARIAAALRADMGVAVVAVRDTGHLLQIERPEEAERIVRDHVRARRFPAVR